MSPVIHGQATETQKPMNVTVALMDGRTFSLPVDSACTSGEVLREVAKRIGLADTYGFSLYISMQEKVILANLADSESPINKAIRTRVRACER